MNAPAPFSERQMEYMHSCFASWLNVAEGGKRGGKNVLQTMIFCMLLERHPNKLHLVAGVSTATAKLNILDCDGYGLLNYFEGRCRQGKYNDRDCVRVQTPTGEKVVLVSGGGKDGDEKLIKGNTYGMAYVTEANECHPKFLKEVFDRTLSSADRKIFHDLNPKEEEHWYYTDILAYHEEQQEQDPDYGYNYGHFTIADNYSIPDDKLRSTLKTYRKGTVWYERDILGRRAVAEGIIFRYFADDPEPYLYAEAQLQEWYKTRIQQAKRDGRKKWLTKIVIGIDFGGNGSKTTLVATGYVNGHHNLYVLDEDGDLPVTESIDSNMICKEYIKFYERVEAQWGEVDWVFPDSASPTMINSLRSAAEAGGLPWRHIKGCRKNEVSERPRTVDLLFTTGRLLINRKCSQLIAAIKRLRWDDDHPDQPEDKNVGNCNDWWDGFCYTWLDFVEFIDLDR